MLTEKTIKIAIVDDHILLRTALAALINSFGNCRVTNEFGSGKQLIEGLLVKDLPEVILLDLNMPEMGGFEAAVWLQQNFPDIHILMLTMYDSELSLIRLLQVGVKGFLKKDIHPDELKFAIESVVRSGYYYSNHTTGKIANLFRRSSHGTRTLEKSMLTEPELNFLKMACSDLTYKEIAQRMNLNPRSIDTLRDQLFIKLDVKSRVGLAMVAIRHGIVNF